MYQETIDHFNDGSLAFNLEDEELNEYLSNNPDPFKVYLLAKFCQLEDISNEKRLRFELDKIKNGKAAYRHFFSLRYCQNLKTKFHTKSRIPLSKPASLESIPIILKNKAGQNKKLSEALEKDRQIVIIGERGAGKTYTLEKVIADCPGGSETFPVFIKLGDAHIAGIYSSMNRFLSDHSSGNILSYKTIKDHFPHTFLLFLLDGIDEIPDFDYPSFTMEINKILTEFSGCRFLIATRPLPHFRNDEILELKTYGLLELKEEQVEAVIDNHFHGNTEKANFLRSSIKNNKRLSCLAANPLLLSLLCEIFQEKEKVPINEGEIYNNFIEALEERDAKREDSAKTYKLSFEQVRLFLEDLAFIKYSSEIRKEQFEQVIKKISIKIKAMHVIDELIARGFIQETPGIDKRYSFIHKVWQAYFAACHFKRIGIDALLPNIKELIEYVKWDDVFLILTCIVDEEAAGRLIKEISNWDMILAARCIGISGYCDIDVAVKIINHLGMIAINKMEITPVRLKAIKSLGISQSEDAINPLIKLLEDDDPGVRKSAADALGVINSELSVNALIDKLKDDDAAACESIIEALGKIRSEKAIEPLVIMVFRDDIFKYVSIKLSEALRAICPDKAIEYLVKILVDSNETEIGCVNAACLLGWMRSDDATDYLISVSRSQNFHQRWIRESAISALGQINSKKSIEVLTGLLKSEDGNVRNSAARALGCSQISEEYLLQLLEEEKFFRVKQTAIYALINIGSKRVVDPLIKLLKDENEFIRKAAADVLGLHKSNKVEEALIELTKYEKQDFVLCTAIEALGSVGSEKCHNILVNYLKDSRKSIRYSAIKALGELQANIAVDGLITASKDTNECIRNEALIALGKIGSEKVIDALVGALDDENEGVRKTAISYLAKIDSEQIEGILIGLLSVNNIRLRRSATLALGHLKSMNAISALTEALKDRELSEEAEKALILLGSDEAMDAMIAHFSTDESLLTKISEFILNSDKQLSKSKMFEVMSLMSGRYAQLGSNSCKNVIYEAVEKLTGETGRRFLEGFTGTDFSLYSGKDMINE